MCFVDRGDASRSAAATASSPSSLARGAHARRCSWSTRSTGPAASTSLEHLAVASAELGELRRVRAALGPRPATASTRSLGELEARLPRGPHYYPDGVVSDQPEAFLAAELLREKLLAQTHDELPHSIAVTADEIEERDDEGRPAARVARWSSASSATRRRAS